MALIDKLSAIGEAIREKTGKEELLTLEQMPVEIASIVSGGSSSGGVKLTEYVVTEDTDRSLWFNAMGIKLVKGLNFLVIKSNSIVNNRTGLILHCLILWDGTPIPQSKPDTMSRFGSIMGWHGSSNSWHIIVGASINSLCSGNTTGLTVSEDGLLSFTTKNTEVITGNYTNSFFGAGNTYYLLQAESEGYC